MKLYFIGADHEVTGSCHVVEVNGKYVMLDCGLEQGRDIFAVPGRVTDLLSSGCNRLIADGAGIATCPEDILEALGLIKSAHKSSVKTDLKKSRSMTEGELKVMRCLDLYPVSMNEIVERSGLKYSDTLSCLLQLELKGCAEKTASGHYIMKMELNP